MSKMKAMRGRHESHDRVGALLQVVLADVDVDDREVATLIALRGAVVEQNVGIALEER